MASTQITQEKSTPHIVAQARSPKRPVKIIHRLLRNLLWLPLCLILVISVVEIVFYVAHIGEEEFLKVEPTVGFLHLENKLVTFRSEGFSQDRINSRGFRDIEYPAQKAPDTVRIAILGDSTTEAFQVPLNDTFVKLLEQRLNASGKQKFQVLNFGMSAFGTAQEYVLYCTQVFAYRPAVTIVMYHIQDSDDNVLPLGDPDPIPRPYFSLNQAHALQVDWGVVKHWLNSDRARLYAVCDQIRRNSRLWGVFAKLEPILHSDPCFVRLASVCGKYFGLVCFHPIEHLPGLRWSPPTLAQIDPSTKLSGTAGIVYKRSYKDAITSGIAKMSAHSPESLSVQALFRMHEACWPVTAALLHQLNKACTATHSRFVVVALPALNNSIFYFRELRYIQKQASHEGFNFINVHKEFPPLAPMQKSTLYYKNHFSKQGHRLVADVLYQQLIRAGLIKS